MSGIGRRVARLEEKAGSRPPCSECGFDGDYGNLGLRVNLSRLDARGSTPGPDRCPECDRVLVIRVSGLKGGPAA